MNSSRTIVPESAGTAANYALGAARNCVVRMAELDPGYQRELVRGFAAYMQTVCEAIEIASRGPGAPPDWVSAVTIGASDAWDALGRALRGIAP